MTFADLCPGLSIKDALEAFRDGCNKDPDRLWITESWIEPRFAELRTLLTEPITHEEAHVLCEAVLKHYDVDDVIEWLEHKPISWQEYEDLRDRRATKRWRLPAWNDVRASQNDQVRAWKELASVPTLLTTERVVTDAEEARRVYGLKTAPCPSCRTAARGLTWIHYTSPSWTWREHCGKAGWLAICEPCSRQIELFQEVESAPVEYDLTKSSNIVERARDQILREIAEQMHLVASDEESFGRACSAMYLIVRKLDGEGLHACEGWKVTLDGREQIPVHEAEAVCDRPIGLRTVRAKRYETGTVKLTVDLIGRNASVTWQFGPLFAFNRNHTIGSDGSLGEGRLGWRS
jgi:hypothetical protein